MIQQDYKEIILANVNEGIGDTWLSLFIFIVLSPFYMVWLNMIFLASLPVSILENIKAKKNKKCKKK